MKRVPRTQLVRIGISNRRDPAAVYHLYEFDRYLGEYTAIDVRNYLLGAPVSFPQERVATVLGVIQSFHGVMINPATREFRGVVVEAPGLEDTDPGLFHRRQGVRIRLPFGDVDLGDPERFE